MSTNGFRRLNSNHTSIIFTYAVGGRLVLMLKMFNLRREASQINVQRHLKNIVVRTSMTVTLSDIRPSKKNSLK